MLFYSGLTISKTHKVSKMNQTLKFDDVDSAIATIRELRTEIIDAETQIADCQKKRALEKEMQASLLAQSKTEANKEYLKTAARACRLGIKAWNLSITAFEKDINAYKFEIDEIRQRIPEARMDH